MFFLRFGGKHNNFDKMKKKQDTFSPGGGRMRHYTADAFFTTVYKQTPSHLMTYIIERFLLFWLFLWQLLVCVCLIWCYLYFPEEKYPVIFFLLPGQTRYFLTMTQSDKQELIWKPKPRQGKSHCLTNFLVAHCCTKVGIFICSEKNRKASEVTGMIDSLEVTTVM